jgi:hypothetical protein
MTSLTFTGDFFTLGMSQLSARAFITLLLLGDYQNVIKLFYYKYLIVKSFMQSNIRLLCVTFCTS